MKEKIYVYKLIILIVLLSAGKGLLNGQIIGTLTVNETGNSYDGLVFTDDVPRTFYSCGGVIYISPNFKADPGTLYTWLKNGRTMHSDTVKSNGKVLELLIIDDNAGDPRPSGSNSYELRYTNGGNAASVEITVVDIPLSVFSLDAEMCQASVKSPQFAQVVYVGSIATVISPLFSILSAVMRVRSDRYMTTPLPDASVFFSLRYASTKVTLCPV